MATLLLRLQGPLQSWGTTSRFDERDSQLEPSKSGVIGLICAALGRDRAERVDDLAVLKMGVRVDREGVLIRDYQTATGVVQADGAIKPKRTVVSPRYYLSDAVFLVALEGELSLLEAIHAALRYPVWPLALGRKACPPSAPVYLADGLVEKTLRQALVSWPLLWKKAREQPSLRLLLEDEKEGAMRLDVPVAPFSERHFGARFVKSVVVPIGEIDAADPIDA